MKVWISKYALTLGLKRVDGESVGVLGALRCSDGNYYDKRHWHDTYEAAAVRAEEMRVAKIRSYEKRLKQLQAMKFEVPNDG